MAGFLLRGLLASVRTRSLLVILIAALPLQPALFAAAPSQVRMDGRSYTRVSAWSAQRNLAVNWIKRDKALEVVRGTNRAVLNVGSREGQINGIHVWLSYPVLQRNGAVYVSDTDLDTTFNPVLFPPRYPANQKVDLVYLDPGHGGRDPGHKAGFRHEKNYTLLLAQEIRTQLARAGLKSVLTRTRDVTLDLEARPAEANAKQADLFISLHYNATSYTSARNAARGVEVYCLTPAGAASTNAGGEGSQSPALPGNRTDARNMLAAYHLQKALVNGISANDRGVRRARFAVLRSAQVPAVLVEAGFMSHPVEGKLIFSDSHRKRTAQAIVAGILAYKRSVESGS